MSPRVKHGKMLGHIEFALKMTLRANHVVGLYAEPHATAEQLSGPRKILIRCPLLAATASVQIWRNLVLDLLMVSHGFLCFCEFHESPAQPLQLSSLSNDTSPFRGHTAVLSTPLTALKAKKVPEYWYTYMHRVA